MDCVFSRRRLQGKKTVELKIIPTSFTTSGMGSISNSNRALTDTTSTTYATFTCDYALPVQAYLSFDTSSIPSDAVIESVVFKVKLGRKSNVSAKTRPYSNSYTPYSYTNITSTSGSIYTFSGQTYTLAQLSATQIEVYLNTQYQGDYVTVYGAEINVTYTI